MGLFPSSSIARLGGNRRKFHPGNIFLYIIDCGFVSAVIVKDIHC